MVGDGDGTIVLGADEAAVRALGAVGVVPRTLEGDGAAPQLHIMDQPSSLQRPTMRQSNVPDACAMDTWRLPALAAQYQRCTWLRYTTPMWEKCVTNIPIIRVIVVIAYVDLLLLTVGVVHTCSLTGGFSATFALQRVSK